MASINTTTTSSAPPPATTTCSISSQPDFAALPIPQDINIVSTPGNDTSWPGMVLCCAPNQVQIVNRCHLWCEVPARYFNGTDRKGAEREVMDCVMRNRDKGEGVRIVGTQFNGGARKGVRGLVWGVVLAGLVWGM